MGPYCAPEEIAWALRVSRESARLAPRQGEIEGVRFGRKWRTPRKEALDREVEMESFR